MGLPKTRLAERHEPRKQRLGRFIENSKIMGVVVRILKKIWKSEAQLHNMPITAITSNFFCQQISTYMWFLERKKSPKALLAGFFGETHLARESQLQLDSLSLQSKGSGEFWGVKRKVDPVFILPK